MTDANQGGGFFSNPSSMVGGEQQVPFPPGYPQGVEVEGMPTDISGYIQVINPQTGQPEMIPAAMVQAYYQQQAADKGFDAAESSDSVGSYCPLTYQNCPESTLCVYWAENPSLSEEDDSEDGVGGDCAYILKMVSSDKANEAKAVFYEKLTDVIEDVEEGNKTTITDMINLLKTFVMLTTERVANDLAGGFESVPAVKKTTDDVVDGQSPTKVTVIAPEGSEAKG